MGEVIQFPGFDERQWLEIETGFRDLMLGHGVSREVIEWILADVKPRVLSAQLSTTISISPDAENPVQEAVTQVSKFMQDATSALILQMLKLEGELYWARFGGDRPPDMPSA
jgi:hypothetical protein